jgi:type IV pilus assembly protein PilM
MRQIKLPSMPSRPHRGAASVVGVDIEPGAVHVAEARAGADGRPVIQRAALRALEAGVVRDGEIVDAPAVTEALRAVFEEHGFDRRVRIGLANQRILVRVVDLPPITDPKELAQAIAFQAPSEVPMPLDQAVLDHVSLGVVETPAGPRSRVVLVAARRDMIDRLLACAREAGLRPEGIDLAAFALVRSLAVDPADEVVAYLAVGGVVNFVVARGGTCLFTRVIGGGVEAMAMELAERRSMTIDEARAAVLGDAPEAEDILADGVRRIAREVRASLDFHHGELAGGELPTAVERVVLTGPGLAIEGMTEALSMLLSMPVEAGSVPVPDGVDAGRYTVAAGLALEQVAA